jgi:hypothetical protein
MAVALTFLRRVRRVSITLFLLLVAGFAAAEDKPYFVTYDSKMEDSGDLEIGINNAFGIPRSGQPAYFAPYLELEYGVTSRWTSEFILEGQSTLNDSTILTGWRLENRFRILPEEHKVNPVLYLEYESINEASRIQKEIVGHSIDFDERNDALRRERAHELEAKLILSSKIHDWNVSENFITEYNLNGSEGFEFGYAFGVSRPLAKPAGKPCRLCRENMVGGMEIYGGLGSTDHFGFHDTAHYAAPVLLWKLSEESALKVSPGIGLTHGSTPVLLRVGYSMEIEGFRQRVKSLFRK